MPRLTNIQVRRGTTAEWAAANPVLGVGEPGLDTDLGVFKMGDGVSVWSALTGKVDAATVKALASDVVLDSRVTGDAFPRLEVQAGGSILTGDGTAAPIGTLGDALRRIPLARTERRLLQPVGVKYRGANMVPKPAHVDAPADPIYAHRAMFLEWDWVGWVKWQVDLAASIGCNAVRLIGDVSGVYDGTFTLATYLANWRQLIEYCASIDMYVYVCGGGANQVTGIQTVAEAAATITALAAAIDLYDNIVGFDVMQEANLTGPEIEQFSIAARAGTSHPITFSLVANDVGDWSDTVQQGATAAYADYFDYHIYYDLTTTRGDSLDTNPFFANHAKPLMIGEFGRALTASNAQVGTRYNPVKGLAQRPDVMGTFVWSIADQSDVAANAYGIFDAAGDRRTVRTDIIRKMPRGEGPWRIVLRPLSGTVLATVTMNAATGTWITPAETDVTVYLGVPCRLDVVMTMDVDILTASDIVEGRILIDGAAVDNSQTLVFGKTVSRGSVAGVYSAEVLDGEHTFTMEFARTVGSGLTDKVYAPMTKAVLTFTPL